MIHGHIQNLLFAGLPTADGGYTPPVDLDGSYLTPDGSQYYVTPAGTEYYSQP